jgi:hypothetical protein
VRDRAAGGPLGGPTARDAGGTPPGGPPVRLLAAPVRPPVSEPVLVMRGRTVVACALVWLFVILPIVACVLGRLN